MSTAKNETTEQYERRKARHRGYNAKRRGGYKGPYRRTKEQQKMKAIDTMRKWRFNLSPEQWDTLFDSQGKKCAICPRTDPEHKKGWVVDHCHVTNRVRGILCSRCNVGLGNFADEVTRLDSAAAYLRATPVVEVYANPRNVTKPWPERNRSNGPGRGATPTKLTDEQALEANRLRNAGATYAELGRKYGCAYQTIRNSINRLAESTNA